MRPEGFDELKREYCGTDRKDCICTDCEGFEAGASAMLEGLRKNGIDVKATDFIHNNITGVSLVARKDGKFIFIPEGKE